MSNLVIFLCGVLVGMMIIWITMRKMRHELDRDGYIKDRKIRVDKYYDLNHTPSFNLIQQIRWGTDDEKHDLAFWMDRWFGL